MKQSKGAKSKTITAFLELKRYVNNTKEVCLTGIVAFSFLVTNKRSNQITGLKFFLEFQ
jgi:hypothetical protein